MSTRRGLVASLAGFVAGCGAGSVATPEVVPACPQTKLVSVRGDSLTTGYYAVDPHSAETRRLEVPFVLRMSQALAGRALCIDHGVGGDTIRGHVSLTDAHRWGSTLAMEPAQIMVLRWGGADALALTEPSVFSDLLERAVLDALARGKRVVLPGVVHMARKPEWQDHIGVTGDVFERLASHAAQIDGVIRGVASGTGCPFVDIRALPFNGPSDIADAVHPSQGYSNRCADAVAAAVSLLV